MLNFGEDGHISFIGKYEGQMYGGNKLWDDPEEAMKAGREIGKLLTARLSPIKPGEVLAAATELVDYKALAEHKRVNILHGVIEGIAEYNGFGGDIEPNGRRLKFET